MNAKTREVVLEILASTKEIRGRYRKERSLEAADDKFKWLGKNKHPNRYDDLNRAWRWGLYEGFNSRPKSYAGLTNEDEPDPEVVQDYEEAYRTGADMYMRELPS